MTKERLAIEDAFRDNIISKDQAEHLLDGLDIIEGVNLILKK